MKRGKVNGDGRMYYELGGGGGFNLKFEAQSTEQESWVGEGLGIGITDMRWMDLSDVSLFIEWLD